MTKPILTVTEYYALRSILSSVESLSYNEPELCEKEIDYSDGGSIQNGKCGFGFTEELEDVIDSPNAEKLFTVVSNLMYKLHMRPWNGTCSTEDQLNCLVQFDHMPEKWDENFDETIQQIESYELVDLEMKDKKARAQEFYDVNEDGLVDIGNGIYFDALNSDLPQ